MQIFFVLHTICMCTTRGKYNVWNMSLVFKRQKQDQSIRKRNCEPWLDKHSQMKQEILKYSRWLVTLSIKPTWRTVFLSMFISFLWYGGWNSTLHTRQSSIHNNKYKVSHKYSCFSWWWALNHSKHVEKRNKHTKKNCAPSWLYLQDYAGMHGQQNVKKKRLVT